MEKTEHDELNASELVTFQCFNEYREAKTSPTTSKLIVNYRQYGIYSLSLSKDKHYILSLSPSLCVWGILDTQALPTGDRGGANGKEDFFDTVSSSSEAQVITVTHTKKACRCERNEPNSTLYIPLFTSVISNTGPPHFLSLSSCKNVTNRFSYIILKKKDYLLLYDDVLT